VARRSSRAPDANDVWVAITAPKTATPSDPPSGLAVLSRPLAVPSRLVGGNRVQDQGGKRRDGERATDTDRHHQQRDIPDRRGDREERHSDQPREHDHEAGQCRLEKTDAFHHACHERVQQCDHSGHRQEQQPRHQRALAPLLLEVQALKKHQPVEGGHRDERRAQAGGHRVRAEEAERHHRVATSGLRDHKGDGSDERHPEGRKNLRGVVAGSASLDDPEGQTAQSDYGCNLAHPVEPNGPARRT
jgi:hypothetical protein